MAKKILGICWLHGQFQAIPLAGGRATGTPWIAPGPVTTPAEFSAALAQAIRETAFTGQQVMVAIDHRHLLFHVQETPPARGKILNRLLSRLVSQNQFFDEPAVYGHVELPATKGHHRQLLALLPHSIVESLHQSCALNAVTLAALVPAAVGFAASLKGLPAPPDETVIVATEIGDSLNLVLGQSNGRLLFSRTMLLGTTAQAERATQEINRTLHYAQQQFGTLVNHLFVSGSHIGTALLNAPIRAGLKTLDCPVIDMTTLARRAVEFGRKHPLNFASRNTSHRRTWQTVAATGLAACLVVSIATAWKVELQIRARGKDAAIAEQQLRTESELADQKEVLLRKARRLEATLDFIGRPNAAPVAAAFPRYLPSVIPDHLRLTGVELSEAPGGWKVHLQGVVVGTAADSSVIIEKLERDLETGIFQVQTTDSTLRQQLRGDTDESIAQRASAAGTERPFFLTGFIP